MFLTIAVSRLNPCLPDGNQYHPLFCFNQFGDLERVMLREGNVHSAANWRAVLEPVVAMGESLGSRPEEAKRTGSGVEFLKMLSNNRRI